MITILRGPRAALARYGVASDLTMRWDVPPDAPAWAGMRAITGQLRAALGEQTVQDVLLTGDVAAPGVAVSLALRPLEPSLSPTQKRARDGLSGMLLASFPAAHPRTNPVARAWADMMAKLVVGRRPLIIVPELERVDLTTLRAARSLVRQTGGALSILIGHDTLIAPAGPFESWLRKLKLREVALLESLPGTYVERIDLRSEPLMARRGTGFDERDPRNVDTMRAAFASYAFDTALRLALELSPKLEGADLREAHALAALSAMHLDTYGRGEDFGVGMMEAGFLGALEGETDPKKRAHWSYQLSVVFARARGEVASALKYGDLAVKEAEGAKAGYLEAWARLGRAQARLLADRPDEASADLEAALVRLDDPVALRETPQTLLETTRAVVANERAKVAAVLGRRDDLRHYRRLAEAHAVAVSPEDRPGYDWLAPVDDELMPTATRVYHSAELARAQAALEPEDECAAARALAGAEMCLGDARAAREHLRVATRISVLTKRSADEIFALQLAGIVAAMRAGAHDDAEQELSIVRGDPRCEGDAAQAEALAMLSLVAAGKKDVQLVLERTKAATAQAQRSEASTAIVRVKKSAADALLAIGKITESRALAEDATHDLPDAGRADAFGVLVTLLATGVDDDEIVAQAVTQASASLPEMSAWWELPRLLPHVKRTLQRAPESFEPTALAALLAAAAQRPDCAELVAEIRALSAA
jgi:hypothetical protein